VSISVPYDLRRAAHSDDISQSINYGSLSKRVLASVDSSSSGQVISFRSLERLVDHVFATCFDAFPTIRRVALDVVKPRALPYADAVRVRSERARDGSRLAQDRFSIERLSCNVIVGLNQCEREDKQLVRFDVEVRRPPLPLPPPTVVAAI
jgi:dihydroneopterin aldolase/2-amino-4-hydroxy-6-hydroxymethyldihydropteridine diphosphokinase/dihydropteroate synthase